MTIVLSTYMVLCPSEFNLLNIACPDLTCDVSNNPCHVFFIIIIFFAKKPKTNGGAYNCLALMHQKKEHNPAGWGNKTNKKQY